MNKKGYIQIAGAVIVIILIIFLTSVITVDRSQLIVKINYDRIEESNILTEKIPLIKSFSTPPENEGKYRLYVELKSRITGETLLIGAKNNMGEGEFYFSDVKIPSFDETLDLKIELKEYVNVLIIRDSLCKEIIIENGKIQEEREIRC